LEWVQIGEVKESLSKIVTLLTTLNHNFLEKNKEQIKMRASTRALPRYPLITKNTLTIT
jgi:hypothetical protein